MTDFLDDATPAEEEEIARLARFEIVLIGLLAAGFAWAVWKTLSRPDRERHERVLCQR